MARSTARAGIRRGLIPLLLLLAVLPAAAQSEPPDSGLREEAQVRLRTVRLRIEAKLPQNAGACLDVGLEELRVAVRGETVPAEKLIELNREKEPTLHVLLIDTSHSMYDWLDYVRETASAYVEQLRPEIDLALLATFDDSLVLVHSASADKQSLQQAIQGIRKSSFTSMVDAVYYVMRELEARRERPVLVLLTDGVDSISFHDRADVNTLAEARSDMISFVIGLSVPFFGRGMRPGMASSKRFMQRLAIRTNGKYFDEPTGYRLDGVFDEIRALLESEAVLTFADPDPLAEPGRIKVSSLHPDCRVETYEHADAAEPEERHLPIRPPYPTPPLSLLVTPDHSYRIEYIMNREGSVDPGCAVESEDPAAMWVMEVEERTIRTCTLDITIEEGPLYHYYSPMRMRPNPWLEQTTRPLAIEVPELPELPRGPEELMDGLAEFALSVADLPVRTGEFQIPEERHARPYHDWPMLCNGKVFFHTRARLAHGLFAFEDYRDWVLSRLDEQAESEIAALKTRFRRYAPDLDDDALDEVARISEDGERILRRAAAPAEVDLQRYLAAWLGDISARELFQRWENDRIDRLIGSDDGQSIDPFKASWTALRKMFFVPSYARVLTLLSPVHDPQRDRIGYWRVVLPRPSWFGQRVKGWKNRLDYSDLPMDLVPDGPLALEGLHVLFERSPQLHAHLRDAGYRVESVDYELLGKPWKQSPESGFRDTRISIELSGPERDGERSVFRIGVDLARKNLDRPLKTKGLELDAGSDDRLAAILDEIELPQAR